MNFALRGLTKKEMIAGFGIKVLLGLLYGYVFMRYYNGDDTWKLFRASLNETRILLSDPGSFFRNEFTPVHALAEGNGVMEIFALYIDDLQYALLVKTMAIMNLLSRGNYYVNVVLFNAIFFFGHYWLFRLMNNLFPEKRKIFFTGIFFFLPAVFWLSGVRIDGLIFFFISLLLYNLCGRIEHSPKRIILMIISFLGVIICRPQFALMLLPAILAYIIARKTEWKPLHVFLSTYAVCIILFFASAAVLPGGGIPGAVASRQHQFLPLKGTRFQLDSLQDSPEGFIQILPQATGNTFLRPYPWEAKGFLQLMASGEIVLFWLIVLAAIRSRHEYWKLRIMHPVILLLLATGISVYISIGYLVPFPGAIVRYKAIPEIMILCAMISMTRWGKNSNYKNI